MMDYETVIPIKTVNDIVKEMQEAAPECGCDGCKCKTDKE